MLTPWKESYDQPRQHIQKQRHYFVSKGLSSQGYGFSSSHVWMWELDYKESWMPRIDAFELWCWRRLLRVPWTARKSKQSILKETQPVHPKGNQSWIFIGRTDAEAETPILGHFMWRTDSFEKTLRAGGKGDDRRWDGWMASLTQWTWVWVNSGSWWWTGSLGML